MERKRIIVSYGDILGFAQWIKRPANAPEDVQSLMGSVYAEFEHYSTSIAGTTKFMGDGIVVIKELCVGHNCRTVLDIMRKSYLFTEKINSIIQNHWPRPHGFRLRLVAGYVYKKMVHCKNCSIGIDTEKINRAPEYIGYPINLAQRLLYVEPQTWCICHESVNQIIGNKRMGVKFRRIPNPKDNPRGIDRDDLRNLSQFSFDSRSIKSEEVNDNGNGNQGTCRKA